MRFITGLAALLLAASSTGCVPQGRHLKLGVGDLVSSEDRERCGQALDRKDELEQCADQAEEKNRIMEIRIAELESDLRRRSQDLTGWQEQRLDEYRTIVKLYLQSLGAEVPPAYEHQNYLVSSVADILVLSALVKQSESQTFDPERSKQAIKDNFIQVKTGTGYCSGVLLTSNGFFVTANHCAPFDEMIHNGKTYWATPLSYNEGRDIRLGKARIPTTDVRPLDFRLAPADKIKAGTKVIVYGTTGEGERFLQMGRIINPRYHTTTRDHDGKVRDTFDSFITSAQSRGGFSGGPVFIEESGELIGITLYGLDNLGGARSDYILKLVEFQRDDEINRLLAMFSQE